jgi:hypothetical protein
MLWHSPRCTWMATHTTCTSQLPFYPPTPPPPLPFLPYALQVKVPRPILRIPMLAIHLQRELAEKGFNPNKQTQCTPLLAAAAIKVGVPPAAGPDLPTLPAVVHSSCKTMASWEGPLAGAAWPPVESQSPGMAELVLGG